MSVNLSENGNESIDDRVDSAVSLVEGRDYLVFGTNDDGTERKLFRNEEKYIIFGRNLDGTEVRCYRFEDNNGIGVYMGGFPCSERFSNRIIPTKRKKNLWQKLKPYLGLEYKL